MDSENNVSVEHITLNPLQLATQLISNGRVDADFASELAVNLAEVGADKLQQQQGNLANTHILVDRFLSGVALLDLASTKVALTHLADQLSEKNAFCHAEGGLTREFRDLVVEAAQKVVGITPKKMTAIETILSDRCYQTPQAAASVDTSGTQEQILDHNDDHDTEEAGPAP